MIWGYHYFWKHPKSFSRPKHIFFCDPFIQLVVGWTIFEFLRNEGILFVKRNSGPPSHRKMSPSCCKCYLLHPVTVERNKSPNLRRSHFYEWLDDPFQDRQNAPEVRRTSTFVQILLTNMASSWCVKSRPSMTLDENWYFWSPDSTSMRSNSMPWSLSPMKNYCIHSGSSQTLDFGAGLLQKRKNN